MLTEGYQPTAHEIELQREVEQLREEADEALRIRDLAVSKSFAFERWVYTNYGAGDLLRMRQATSDVGEAV